jgi:hypothetical protein
MYGKIFQQIYDGSLRSDPMVRLVFMDMVILADQDGIVDMTHEAIAARTNVPLQDVQDAIKQLESSDPKSRSPKENGVRIKRLDNHRDWGWELINYEYYLRKGTRADKNEKDRVRMAKIRKKNKGVAKSSEALPLVSDVAHIDIDIDIDKDIKKSGVFTPPSKEILKEASIRKINAEIETITEKLYQEKIFLKVHAFKNKMLKINQNERAIFHTLSRCYLKRNFEKGGAWGYCMKIMQVENGNYNESDYNKTS